MSSSNTNIKGIDKVYVLSVRAFDERIAHIRAQLTRHQIDFEFVFDCDVPQMTPEDLSLFGPSNMQRAHQSLVLKNVAVWRKMVAQNIPRALVLEDDAILSDDFKTALEEIVAACDTLEAGYLVFLGGADVRLPAGFLNDSAPLVKKRMTTADGFIIDKTIAEKRLAWLQNNLITLPADGLMCHIDEQINCPHYWPKKALVEQASCTGQFTTTLDHSRQKHSLLYNRVRYHLRKFKNQTVRRWLRRIR